MRRFLSPAWLAAIAVMLVAIVAFVLWVTPSNDYILLPDKPHSVSPLVTVEHPRSAGADDGGIYFLAVVVRKASLLERTFPWLREGATLVPADALRTPGISDAAQRRIDARDMSLSQRIAAAVALRELGYEVVTRRSGVRISSVIGGTPAVGKLTPTDVVVSLDGKHVGSPSELRQLMADRRPGNVVRLGVRDSHGLRTVRIRTVADPHQPSHAVIGVLIDQAAQIKLPFRVTIDPGNVVGPSAGLAFALEVMEKLGRNVDRGYKVAATGELELDGSVLPIGAVRQKAIEAKDAHVDILLVPAGDNAAVARKDAGDVKVIAVQSFQQALRKLATMPQQG